MHVPGCSGMFHVPDFMDGQDFLGVPTPPFHCFGTPVFSHDVTAAILVSQNNETAAMLVSQANPVGIEFLSYANAFFCSNNFA